MIEIFYQKNDYQPLFTKCNDLVKLYDIQNYVPLYNKFFSLQETNFNSINLNHKLFITNINEKISENIYNIELNNNTKKQSFFKFSPLLDPVKYMIGKYEKNNLELLPNKKNNPENIHEKLLDENNSSYVDSFFSYLSSKLLENYNFIHSIDFYGSFLGIKHDYLFNVADDLDYLIDSEYFHKHKNDLFEITENIDHIFEENTRKYREKLNILNDNCEKLSLCDIEEFDSVFKDNLEPANNKNEEKELPLENVDYSLVFENINKSNRSSFNNTDSEGTCSSRSSNTSESGCETQSDEEELNSEESEIESCSNSEYSDISTDDCIESKIKKFPVQMICLEKMEDTLDSYFENNDISNDEWKSILFQVIITLFVYQKVFDLTHNDLHTNNVMYNTTDKKYLNYHINGKYYKVPTFGKIYKIIDFGRAIYKFKGKVICSDSYHPSGDAATQYNCEPYFNDKKPRLEPNKSFDLCRLGCSLFDHFFENVEEVQFCKNKVGLLINEWCLDDKNRNILYKLNGEERYENFKLYKMIARQVHNHEPKKYIDHELFSNFRTSKKNINKKSKIIDIDSIPEYK
jgi:hypothetical protein